MSEDRDDTDEIRVAYRKFLADSEPAELSPEALGYIRHCLREVVRAATLMHETPDMSHHPFFALIALEDGGERFEEFLMSVPRERALGEEP